MSKMHSTSLLSTPWPFWTGILSQVSKNDDEKNVASKSNLALVRFMHAVIVIVLALLTFFNLPLNLQ